MASKHEFDELLERKRQASSLPSSVDLKKLKTEVLSFIEENQNFQGILSETYETEEKKLRESELDGQDVTSESFVCDCIYMLKSQAKRASCSLDLLAAESLSKKLFEEVIAGCPGEPNQFLNEKQKAVLSTIIHIIKTLLSEHSFNRVHFAKCLSSEHRSNGVGLPLEVLWTLHTSHITSFNTYLACCSYNSVSCEALVKGLINVCNPSLSMEHDKQIAMLSVFFGVLVPLAYKDKTNNEKRTNLEKVAEDILQKVIDSDGDMPQPSLCNDEELSKNSSRLGVFEVVRSIQEIPEQVMSRFFTDQIHKLLFKTTGSSKVSHAVMNQNRWNFSLLAEQTRTRFQQFLYMFKPSMIMDQLTQAFSRKEVDWAITLSFLSVLLVCEEEAANLIKEYTDGLLKEVMVSCDGHTMAVLLLVIRQSALEGVHVFPSYLTWFKCKFGDMTTSLLNNKKTVQFFFQFLTDLVPYEPAFYLKVHIIKSPQVPGKLRTFVQDYSALAKTRLMDLKQNPSEAALRRLSYLRDSLQEPVELTDVYDHEISVLASPEEKSEQHKLQQQANQEIVKVLDSFQKTGKVPGSVMEASIFRKPYFIGRFLPTLLTPRKLPENPDTRSRLIKTLSKAGKIPSNMLDAYHKACEKMAFDHDDSSSEDDTSLSDMDKLNKNLKNLTKDILHAIRHNDKTNKSSVSAKLSLLAGHIKSILKTDNQASSLPHTTPVIIDVESPSLDVKSVQIIDTLLNAFCRTCTAARTTDCNEQLRFKWSADFVAMVTSIPAIHTALYFRLWDLLCSKGALSLNMQHTQELAAFLCYLSSYQHQLTPVVLMNIDNRLCSDQNGNNFSFVELIFGLNLFTSCQWMEFNIRLCSAYLQHAAMAFTNIIAASSINTVEAMTKSTCIVPASLIKKLWYLMHRFSFAALSSLGSISFVNTIEIINAVRTTSLYKNLSATVPKVSFGEWLTCEALIDRDEDIFTTTDRYQYHDATVLGHFLPMDESDGGCSNSYRTACTVILDKVLDNKMTYSTTVSHNCQSSNPRKSTSKHGTVDLIHLLERIIQLLAQKSQDESHLPGNTRRSWLLEQYYRRTEKVKVDEIKESTPHSVLLENETTSFTELMVQLPPYLLFCDHPDQPTPDVSSSVVSFVNDSLFVHSSLSCCLPLNVTAHLLKGILTVSRIKEGRSSDISAPMLKQFCQDCPLFFVSMQYYWEQVSITISCLCGIQVMPSVFGDAGTLHKWITSLCSGSSVSMATPLAYPSWLITPCLFLGLLTSQNPVHCVQRLATLMESIFMRKIAVCMLACILSTFAEMVLHGNEVSQDKQLWRLAMELLKSYPDVLVAFVDDRSHPYAEELHHLRTFILPHNNSSLLPVVFFSLLIECGQSVLEKVKEFPQFPQITLTMNQKFTQLRKMCLENQAYKSCEKPFELDFARKVLQFLSQHVRS